MPFLEIRGSNGKGRPALQLRKGGIRADSHQINRISGFIGEYASVNPGYSPLVLAELLQERFLIGPGEAKKLAGIVAGELSVGKLYLTAMELNLTFNCNLDCKYCFVRRKSAHERMSVATARKAIGLLLDRAAAPVVAITLIGGEPLLELALIKQIVPSATEAARKRNLDINWAITTNGTLIDEDALKFFARYKIHALLSIDGGRVQSRPLPPHQKWRGHLAENR